MVQSLRTARGQCAWTILDVRAPEGALGHDPDTINREATLSLSRQSVNGAEFLDFYNNSYDDEIQYGIRMQKRGLGSYRDFVFDYYDGPLDSGGTDTYFEVMRLKHTSGNVGIGTKDPAAKLHIKRDLLLQRATGGDDTTISFANEADATTIRAQIRFTMAGTKRRSVR